MDGDARHKNGTAARGLAAPCSSEMLTWMVLRLRHDHPGRRAPGWSPVPHRRNVACEAGREWSGTWASTLQAGNRDPRHLCPAEAGHSLL